MKFDWKNKLTKIIPLALLVGIVLVLLPTHFAHGESTCLPLPGLFNLGGCIGSIFYWVIYLLSVLAGTVIALILWCIELMLQFNMNVVNTTFVQTGFSVTLGLANLGFVLGIIIVALATILRRETYGIKSILWKLIIMAIFVNFALVIAAPIVGFGNNLTLFFIHGMPGYANSTSGGTALSGFDNLSSAIAGVFQPQRLISPENASTTVNSVVQSGVGFLGTTLGGILGVTMALVALVAMCVVLIVLFVMLIIRYVYLEVLLVIAPLAWMAWIFPSTSKHFSKWWDRFIKQVFFPAIAMFFIYLVVSIGRDISPGQNVSVVPAGTSWLGGFLQSLTYGLLGSTIGSFINDALIIGLMIAGLTMASSLSTEGSKLAATAVAKVRDSVTGLAVNRGKKVARGTAKQLRLDKLANRVRVGQLGQGRLKNVPLVGAVARAVQSGAATAARGAQGYMTNADLVENAQKDVPKDSALVEKDLAAGNLSMEKTFAYLIQRLKDGLLKKDDKVGSQTVEEFFKTHKGDIKDFGQGKLAYDYRVMRGRTENIEAADGVGGGDAMVKVLKDVKDQFGRTIYAADEQVKASDLLAASYREMAQSYTKEIAGKIDINQMSEEELKRTIGAFSLYSPGLIAPLLKKAKSPALTRIEVSYENAIKEKGNKVPGELAAEKAAILANKTLTPDQKKESADQIDALAKIIAAKVGQIGVTGEPGKGDPTRVIERALGANVAFFSGLDFEERKEGAPPKP